MKNLLCIIFFLLNYLARGQFLDSLIVQSTTTLNINSGKLVGSELPELMELLNNTQFVSLAEEHEVTEVNEFSAALFSLLNSTYDYRYMALEQGPVLCQELNKRIMSGEKEPVKNYALKYRRAFHFSSDQELAFIQSSAKLADTDDFLWGCNQEYGAEHVLELLLNHGTGHSKTILEKLIAHAHSIEKDRKNNVPYMCCISKTDDFFKLGELNYEKDTVKANEYVEALLTSEEIYGFFKNSSKDNPTLYENNFNREAYLKQQFLKHYQNAIRKDDRIPKVFLKFGHWHLENGLGPSKILTLGSFVSGLAFENNLNNLTIGVFINNRPGDFRGYSVGSLREFICNRLPAGKFTLVNTAPLRKYFYNKEVRSEIPDELQDSFEDLIYSYDALLYIKDATSVSWDLVYGTNN